MLSKDDLIDLIVRHLKGLPPDSPAVPHAPPTKPSGRLFLSEYEIKKLLTPGAMELTVPAEAILSPLATDWLVLKGVRVVRK